MAPGTIVDSLSRRGDKGAEMPCMSCPRCGLVIPLRAPFLTLSRCPRCLAKARISVPMLILEHARGDEREEVSLGELVIRTKREQEVWVLALHGQLDLASAPALQQQLDAARAVGVRRVVVDLSGLEFLDSTGLQVLLYAQRRLASNRQALSLRRGSRAIQRVFELTHTEGVFPFE